MLCSWCRSIQVKITNGFYWQSVLAIIFIQLEIFTFNIIKDREGFFLEIMLDLKEISNNRETHNSHKGIISIIVKLIKIYKVAKLINKIIVALK